MKGGKLKTMREEKYHKAKRSERNVMRRRERERELKAGKIMKGW